MINHNVCTEIADFQVVAGILDEEFIKIVEGLEENFHKVQKGFIDTELIKDKDPHKWVMVQHWESIEASKEASKMMMKTPVTESFRQVLDPESVKIRYLKHVKKWGKLIE